MAESYADMDVRTADSTTTEGPKICAECLHCTEDYQCTRDAVCVTSLVTGDPIWAGGTYDCEEERNGGGVFSSRCGHKGSYWEARATAELTLEVDPATMVDMNDMEARTYGDISREFGIIDDINEKRAQHTETGKTYEDMAKELDIGPTRGWHA